MKTKTIILTCLLLLTGIIAQAGTLDERLWGTWGLETATVTTGSDVKAYTVESLLADRDKLPKNLFLSLLFFNDQMGACSSEEALVYEFDMNVKGSFSTDNGQLTVTLREKQPRTFAYVIENDKLKVRYTQGNTQYDLIYKLIK